MGEPPTIAGNDQDLSFLASTSSTSFHGLGVRKRVDSNADESFESMIALDRGRGKRPRVSAMAIPSTYGRPNSIGFGPDRLPRTAPLFNDLDDFSNSSSIYYSPRRADRSFGGNSSFASTSRAASPFLAGDHSFTMSISASEPRTQATSGLIRSLSSSSLRAPSPGPTYPENSARYWTRNSRITLDYGPPITTSNESTARLLGCSANNFVYFTRGNRVHFKNLSSNHNEDVGQLFKLGTSHGNLRALEFDRKTPTNVLAIGTSKGIIQLWDVQAKKATTTWSTTKDTTAMAWNGPILTVGSAKGVIRNYDTRSPASKMKEQCRKLIRHEAEITTLDWSVDGKFLASGDANGNVYCWEKGLGPPLTVGEPVQRRKKIRQSGMISSVAWCPWQPKVLATGDDRGILRLWNINDYRSASNALNPGKLDTGASITGVHFSSHCKEILTTHGPRVGDHRPIDLNNPRPCVSNALAVHSFSTLGHVFAFRLPSDKPIGESVLDSSGTKIIYNTPSELKINVVEVWTRRKEAPKRERELRRSKSMLSIGSTSSSYSMIR